MKIFELNNGDMCLVVLALGGWGRENSGESGLSSVEMVGTFHCIMLS